MTSLARSENLDATVGKALFERIWAPAPASTSTTDGLGPLFNARSCVGCHEGGGRGRLAIDHAGHLEGDGAVVRLADPAGHPDPVYGHQIQTEAVQGISPEATVRITWQEQVERFDDGSEVTLRRPVVSLGDLAYGPLGPETQAVLRLAPDLVAAGRIARVDMASAGLGAEARPFGRKATEPSLAGQIGTAFSRDLGLSTAAHPDAAGECTARQTPCREAPQGAYGNNVELSDEIVGALVHYVEGLGRPARAEVPAPGDDLALFEAAGCAGCHAPELPGRDGSAVTLFSDLRLHDLGPELADPMPADGRSGSEWRTAPLIGIGRALAQGRQLLHDGRARAVSEAILWHGGRAMAVVDAYRKLPMDRRARLEAFVASH